MTKFEFQEKLGAQIEEVDYKAIEYVYTWHPVISATNGKWQIAEIYKLGGMAVIIDMKATAEKAEKLDAEMRHAKSVVEAAEESLKELQQKWQAMKLGREIAEV